MSSLSGNSFAEGLTTVKAYGIMTLMDRIDTITQDTENFVTVARGGSDDCTYVVTAEKDFFRIDMVEVTSDDEGNTSYLSRSAQIFSFQGYDQNGVVQKMTFTGDYYELVKALQR